MRLVHSMEQIPALSSYLVSINLKLSPKLVEETG